MLLHIKSNEGASTIAWLALEFKLTLSVQQFKAPKCPPCIKPCKFRPFSNLYVWTCENQKCFLYYIASYSPKKIASVALGEKRSHKIITTLDAFILKVQN